MRKGQVRLRSGTWDWIESEIFTTETGEIPCKILHLENQDGEHDYMERRIPLHWTDYEPWRIKLFARHADFREFTDRRGRKWTVRLLPQPKSTAPGPGNLPFEPHRWAPPEPRRMRLTAAGQTPFEVELPVDTLPGDLTLGELLSAVSDRQ